MEIDLKAIRDGVVVHARGEPAGADQRVAIEVDASAILRSSWGVLRDCLPRPPQMYTPSSWARGLRPRFNAPITEVVMPEECQSMPITDPSAWNQNGSLSRESSAGRP